jgi:ATP-dependent DNA helicase RecQ
MEVIRSVLDGTDTLALLPTGGGKSICYQLPGLVLDGVCVVITPLIALMKDQVQNLRNRGIESASIYSGLSKHEIDSILSACFHGKIKFLYLSPERLLSEMMMEALSRMNVNFFAVDEAHCISEWGYDFRPSYLQIAQVRTLHPDRPVLALTATATTRVRQDIVKQLEFRSPAIFVSSFSRPNISFLVYRTEDRYRRISEIIRGVKGSCIVYVRNRKKTREISDYLNRTGISADYYHAGLPVALRESKQDAWISNRISTIVSTNAFGMGIDKPDVRAVIHSGPPDSLEAYYQEAGRAGRDGKESYAVLLYEPEEVRSLEEKVSLTMPEIGLIRKIYNAIGNYLSVPVGGGMATSQDFDIQAFCNSHDMHPVTVANSIRVLEQEGYLQMNDAWFIPSKVRIVISPSDLYSYRVSNEDADPLLKVLLRTSEGVFTNFTPYNENNIAHLLNQSVEVVRSVMSKLIIDGVITTTPVKDMPQLIYLTPREKESYVEIDEKAYNLRRDAFDGRIMAVKNYVENGTNCRVSMLLYYLGESPDSRCGKCDYCRKINETGLSELKIHDIQNAIYKMLKDTHSMSVKEITGKLELHPHETDSVLEIIRMMADGNYLTLKEGAISLKKPNEET